MAKKRVYELAKDLKLTTQEMMRVLTRLNVSVKTHMSALEDTDIGRIKDYLTEIQKPLPKPPVPPARTVEPETKVQPPRPQGRDFSYGRGVDNRPRTGPPPQQRFAPPGAQAQRDRQQEPQGPAVRKPNPDVRPQMQGNRPQPAPGTRPYPAGVRPGPVSPGTRPMAPGTRQAGPYQQDARPQSNDANRGMRPPRPYSPPGRMQGPGPGMGPRPGPGPGMDRPGNAAPGSPPSSFGAPAGRPPVPGRSPRPVGQGRPEPARPAAGYPPKPAPQLSKPGPKGPGKPAPKHTPRVEQKGPRFKTNAPEPDLRRIGDEDESRLRRRFGKGRGAQKPGQQPRQEAVQVRKITVGDTVVVQELAKRMGKTAADVIKKLINMGVMAAAIQEIDSETACIIAAEYGIEVEIKSEKAMLEIEDIDDPPASLEERPPVVTVMGHVDHGKTSLLDAVRKTKVTATEAGGITQHIGAYQVEIKGKKITFLDTPGHEAFTAMRARGAQVTDIAVLVVAADDGVMPQTIEALNHAKAAEVPIIVAVNKIDKPDANPERVKQQLTEYGLIAEEWGGKTIFVPVSATKSQGLDTLLEMILLVAEVAELKANAHRPARGIVIEAELDKGRGPVATMLVQKGTLNVGDSLVIGNTFAKVRALVNHKGQRVKEATPSEPVEVVGLSEVPEAGDVFQVVNDERLAKEIAQRRQVVRREEEFKRFGRVKLDDLFKRLESGGIKDLNVVLKADVQGSIEALRQALERLNTEEVQLNIIHSGVGAITETDVMLAAASNAIIFGFNIRPDNNARRAAENEHVDIHLYRVIYEIIEDVRSAMSGLLSPEMREVIQGRAEVRQVFRVAKVGVIAGSYILEGKITNRSLVRIIRDGVVIHEGKLASLHRFKDDVKEVAQGYECGIGIDKFNDIKEKDVIEAFTREEIQRKL